MPRRGHSGALTQSENVVNKEIKWRYLRPAWFLFLSHANMPIKLAKKIMAHSDKVGMGAGVLATNEAAEFTGAVTFVKVHTAPCPAQAPVQPVNVQPLPGVAVQTVVPPKSTVAGTHIAVPVPADTVAVAGLVTITKVA